MKTNLVLNKLAFSYRHKKIFSANTPLPVALSSRGLFTGHDRSNEHRGHDQGIRHEVNVSDITPTHPVINDGTYSQMILCKYIMKIENFNILLSFKVRNCRELLHKCMLISNKLVSKIERFENIFSLLWKYVLIVIIDLYYHQRILVCFYYYFHPLDTFWIASISYTQSTISNVWS